MTAKATAAILIVTLGAAASLAITAAGDPPITNQPATVYRTITNTKTVSRRLEGRTIHWWRQRAVANRREANTRRITLQRIRRFINARWTPTVHYAIALSHAVYGYDLTRRTHCESTNNPFAVSPGGHQGLLQFLGSTWRTTPFAGFSPFDPVAAELAGGWMIRAGRSGEWSCHL